MEFYLKNTKPFSKYNPVKVPKNFERLIFNIRCFPNKEKELLFKKKSEAMMANRMEN